MAGYLRNPENAPLEEINLIVEALDSVQRSSALQIQAANARLQQGNLSPAEIDALRDEIAAAQDLMAQAARAIDVLRERYLAALLEQSGLGAFELDPADVDALNATRSFKIDSTIEEFVRQTDPNAFERSTDINAFQRSQNINAFAPGGTLSDANKEVKALTEIYHLILKILAIAGPLVGIRTRASVQTASYERNARSTERAGTGTIRFYEPLFTDEALAYLMMQGDCPEKENLKALRDVSLIHFFEKKERSLSANYSEQKAGYVNCTSQKQEGIASMVLGGAEEPNEVSLWKNNAKLSWRMIDETFQTQEQFSAVESAIFASTAAWNKVKPGGVYFERAENRKDAVFLVRFQKGGGNKEAVAFFPTEHVPGLSALRVFENAVKPENMAHLSNVLCHEVGHIMGFRHEFALEKERSFQAGEADGISDPNSVMSYNYPPKITLSDVKSSRMVYQKFVEGTTLKLDDGRGNMNEFVVKRVDPLVGAE